MLGTAVYGSDPQQTGLLRGSLNGKLQEQQPACFSVHHLQLQVDDG